MKLRAKKNRPCDRFFENNLYYLEAEPEAAAGAAAGAEAEAAGAAAGAEAEAAGAEASIEAEAAGAAGAGVASIDAAGAAGAGVEASIEAGAEADADSGPLLPQPTKATANRETINRDFFMGFSLNNSKKVLKQLR